jgi:hypothetical protein
MVEESSQAAPDVEKKIKKQRNHGQNTKKHVTRLKEWSE